MIAYSFSRMDLSSANVLTGLSIVIAVMAIIVLYHLIFIVVDVRKITKRVEDITAEVEKVILKPISMADQILSWVMEHIESRKKKHHHLK